MKALGWFIIAAVWLIGVVALKFGLPFGFVGGFDIAVSPMHGASPHTSIFLARSLLYLILFGWIIPLTLGIFHLFSKR